MVPFKFKKKNKVSVSLNPHHKIIIPALYKEQTNITQKQHFLLSTAFPMHSQLEFKIPLPQGEDALGSVSRSYNYASIKAIQRKLCLHSL